MNTPLAPLRASLLAALGVATLVGCGSSVSDGEGGGTSAAGCEGETALGSTGFAQCDDVSINRVGPATCDNGTPNQLACAGTEDVLNCTSDADCTEGANGRCISNGGGFDGVPSCGCAYGCTTDADCAEGTVCACAGMAEGLDYSRCVAAGCDAEEDCGGGECGLVSYDDGCGRQVSLACRTDRDECRSSLDCAEGEECGPTYDAEEVYLSCQTTGCAIGRPMTIEGVARAGDVVARSDWAAELGAPAHAATIEVDASLGGLRGRLLGALRAS